MWAERVNLPLSLSGWYAYTFGDGYAEPTWITAGLPIAISIDACARVMSATTADGSKLSNQRVTSLLTPSSEAAAVIRATPCRRAAIAAPAPVGVTEAIAGLLLDIVTVAFSSVTSWPLVSRPRSVSGTEAPADRVIVSAGASERPSAAVKNTRESDGVDEYSSSSFNWKLAVGLPRTISTRANRAVTSGNDDLSMLANVCSGRNFEKTGCQVTLSFELSTRKPVMFATLVRKLRTISLNGVAPPRSTPSHTMESSCRSLINGCQNVATLPSTAFGARPLETSELRVTLRPSARLPGWASAGSAANRTAISAATVQMEDGAALRMRRVLCLVM